jgi:DNA invertase Pin-like site-specific DNA recombinase
MEKSRDYATRHKLELIEEITDSGISAFRGRNVANGGLARFLAAVRAKQIKRGSYLLIESFDRLSRQDPFTSFGLFSEIIRAGIIIVTLVDERQYGNGNQSDLAVLINSLLSMARAHEESEIKSKRLSATWANKRAKAATRPLTAACPSWLHLPRLPRGQQNGNDNPRHFTLIKERVAVVRKIFEDSASGFGDYSICQRFNENKIPTFSNTRGWGASSVAKILTNRSVLGEFQPHIIHGKKRIPHGEPIQDYFPAIIDNSLFYRAQAARSQRLIKGKPRGGRKSNFSNLFSGLLKCAYCESPVYFENKGRSQFYLVCYAARSGHGCGERKGWIYRDFESSFITMVEDVDFTSIIKSDGANRARRDLETQIDALRAEQASIQEKQEAAFALLAKANVDYVSRKLQELDQQSFEVKTRLDGKEKELTALVRDAKNACESRDQITSLFEQLRSLDVRVKAASRLKSFVNVIYVAPVGWKKKYPLAFVPGDDNRKFVSLCLSDAKVRKCPFFIVHFKQATQLVACFIHPDPDMVVPIFYFHWVEEKAKASSILLAKRA